MDFDSPCIKHFFPPSIGECFFCCLTILFWLATVFLTLSLAVELVGVSLAEAHFVGHAQAGGGVEGPDGQVT